MPEVPAVNVAHALVVYAEPLAARHRVVVIGDSSLGLDARLVDVGARIVHVYDPDVARARAHAKLAARGAVIRELPEGDLDVRQGAFDLAIVPDLACVADRAALLVRVRKLVGNDGAALIAARTARADTADAGAIDYYEMFDLVALQFANVRMIGQVPFAGVAFAELGDTNEAPAVSVDTQLAGESEAPEVTIALVAQRDVRLDPYAIIQLPRDTESAASTRFALPSDHADLAAAVLRADLLQTQIEEQRAALVRLGAEGDRANRVDELEAALHERTAKLKDAETRAGDHYVRAERLTHDVRRLDEDLARHRDRAVRLAKDLDDEKKNRARVEAELAAIRKNTESAQSRERAVLLEEALRSAEEAAAVLQQRSIEAERAIARRETQLAALATELDAVRATPSVDPDLLSALGALTARAESAEARAAMLDAQIAEIGDGHASELVQLEAVLRERAQAIAKAEHEVRRREAIVRELVLALEEAGAEAGAGDTAPVQSRPEAHQTIASRADDEMRAHFDRATTENAALRGKLDALALDVARREGELQARAWRIAELEERVASLEARAAAESATGKGKGAKPGAIPASAVPASAATASAATASADRLELLALRQALGQEHEARVRAESGEELSRARADLTRQAVLLEQLSRELENRDVAVERVPAAANDSHHGTGQDADPAQT